MNSRELSRPYLIAFLIVLAVSGSVILKWTGDSWTDAIATVLIALMIGLAGRGFARIVGKAR